MRTELVMQLARDTWQPLPQLIFKLNFDVVVFSGLNRLTDLVMVQLYTMREVRLW